MPLAVFLAQPYRKADLAGVGTDLGVCGIVVSTEAHASSGPCGRKENMPSRKVWSRPRLVVVGRGSPEENVLAVCKQHGHDFGPRSPNCKKDKEEFLCQMSSLT